MGSIRPGNRMEHVSPNSGGEYDRRNCNSFRKVLEYFSLMIPVHLDSVSLNSPWQCASIQVNQSSKEWLQITNKGAVSNLGSFVALVRRTRDNDPGQMPRSLAFIIEKNGSA